MSKKILAVAAILLSSLAHAGCDIEDQPQVVGTNSLAQKHGTLAAYSAPVKSITQLKTHVALQSKASPLSALSPQGQQEFINSLTFNEHGLTGYNYRVLEKELTVSQIYAILSLVGSQHNISLFKKAKVVNQLDASLLGGGMSTDVADDCHPIGTPGGGTPGGGTPGGGTPGGGTSGGSDSGSTSPGTGTGSPVDYQNYACSARATCAYSFNHICTRNC